MRVTNQPSSQSASKLYKREHRMVSSLILIKRKRGDFKGIIIQRRVGGRTCGHLSLLKENQTCMHEGFHPEGRDSGLHAARIGLEQGRGVSRTSWQPAYLARFVASPL